MIRTEQVVINDIFFTRTYSDANRYVVRDGVSYEEALDPSSLMREYTEGAIITSEEEPNDDIYELLEDDVVIFSPEEEPDYFNEHETEPNFFA